MGAQRAERPNLVSDNTNGITNFPDRSQPSEPWLTRYGVDYRPRTASAKFPQSALVSVIKSLNNFRKNVPINDGYLTKSVLESLRVLLQQLLQSRCEKY